MEASEKARITQEIDDLLALSRQRLRHSDFLGAQRAARCAIALKDQLAGKVPSEAISKPATRLGNRPAATPDRNYRNQDLSGDK
jgi:hypothetical protein